MKFIFFTSRSPLGWLIRKLGNTKYDHISVMIDDMVFEATPFKGVIKTWSVFYNRSATRSIHVYLKDDEIERVMEYAYSQLYKGYDWIGVLSFLFKKLKPKRTKWYCSEFGAYLYNKATNSNINQRITPEELFSQLKYEIQSRTENQN